MERVSEFLKRKRKEAGLTQEEFALRSGLGLRFVRELEQGKKSCRTDKVNQALEMFGCCLGVVRIERKNEEEDKK
ncbi:helix-turn-helix transcriptional regulator [bacterium]|nr:helix-turn-helix transcriptional regulator [bacterium]